MASVTVNLTGFEEITAGAATWQDNVSLGSTFSDLNGEEQILQAFAIVAQGANAGMVQISITGAINDRFTAAFEATGRIIVEASDGEMLEVMIANADMSETYFWTPTNSAEVIAFTTHVIGLTDRNATLTLTDDPPVVNVAPSFADDTGDAQTWEMGTAITAITVPEADGTPAPTYAVEGVLPAGIAFDTGTRVISGTPTATGSGTITIRASNSEGNADWTVAYTTNAPPPTETAPARPAAPTLTVDSDTEITAVGVEPDDGGDTITSYDWRHRITSPLGAWVNRSNVTNLTQVFTGLEAARTYRFQFRATNSVGNSQYSPNANATTDATPTTLTAPAFADDTGDAQTWTTGVAIASINVPAATGNPTPTYAVQGSLPAGIAFSAATRTISGTPAAAGSGTITIRATNSEGNDDWSIAFVTTDPPPTTTTTYEVRVKATAGGFADSDYSDIATVDVTT